MNRPPQRNLPPAPPPGADDPSIPVLTERLGLPPLDFDTTLPLIDTTMPVIEPTRPPVEDEPEVIPVDAIPAASAPAAGAAGASAPMAAVNVLGATASPALPAAPPPADGRHWARIEIELRTSILEQIAARLPQEVDAIVQARMKAALAQFQEALATETRRAVAASLHEIVERAVRIELERLRNSNRG